MLHSPDFCEACGNSFPPGQECTPCQAQSESAKANRVGAILGAADGLTIVVSLLFGHSPALFHAAVDAGIGEFVGMGAALWLTNRRQVMAAVLCGLATFLGCVVPAIPFLFLGGGAALSAATITALFCGAIVCWLRPEKGLLAIAETYGVLAAAGLLCWAVSFA